MTMQTCYRHDDRRAGVRCQRCERPICPSCMHQASVGFHCPECTHRQAQRVHTPRTLLKSPIVTQALVAANVAVYLAGYGGGDRRLLDGALSGVAVADGEWWRIVTAGFLHANLIHLAFNMLALWNLGGALEPAVGRVRFAAIYATSLLAGSFGVLVLDPDALTVGASGAVFGLMGAALAGFRARGIDPFSTGLGGVVVLNLLITFTIPGISIGGHVGGLIGGAVCGWLLLDVGPRAFGERSPAPLVVVALLAGACGVGSLVVV